MATEAEKTDSKANPPAAFTVKTGNAHLDSILARAAHLLAKVQARPGVAHILRATDRFNDRLGSQFGAAITYFSFLSLIPLLMVSFAAGGFILASHPDLLTQLINKIVNSISDANVAATLKSTVNTAIQQRTVVGISGLLIALYSGVSWLGNLREAIHAQSRDVWERKPQDSEKIYYRYLRDFLSLVGLLLALVVTLSLTSIAGPAQEAIVDALGLAHIDWLRPALTVIALTISISANYLLFLWIFWVLPRHKPARKALLRGTLLAAVGFEALKFAMTVILPRITNSPSGAAFGSVIGLMAFFYFFALLILFCAAWIATAHYEE